MLVGNPVLRIGLLREDSLINLDRPFLIGGAGRPDWMPVLGNSGLSEELRLLELLNRNVEDSLDQNAQVRA